MEVTRDPLFKRARDSSRAVTVRDVLRDAWLTRSVTGMTSRQGVTVGVTVGHGHFSGSK